MYQRKIQISRIVRNDFSTGIGSVEMYGESICQAVKRSGEPCTNKAYYRVQEKLLCGVHSDKKTREKLPVNPNKKVKKERFIQGMKDLIEEKRVTDGPGQVVLSKLRMMKEAEYIPGFLRVFPNFLHRKRGDGCCYPSLSPKPMGPVEHGQPGLPKALNLENFHQGNKCFPDEIKGEEILPSFYETRLKMYQDPVPHRHKQTATGNVPVFSVWVDKEGEEHRISYLESRQFYCHFYERFALKDPALQELKDMIGKGYNIQICGYDCPKVWGKQTPEEAYHDPSNPFGHEWVLYSLLTLKESEYPWRKHKTFEY